jgi:hypothetical protein
VRERGREGGVFYSVLKFEYGRHPGYNARPRSGYGQTVS